MSSTSSGNVGRNTLDYIVNILKFIFGNRHYGYMINFGYDKGINEMKIITLNYFKSSDIFISFGTLYISQHYFVCTEV